MSMRGGHPPFKKHDLNPSMCTYTGNGREIRERVRRGKWQTNSPRKYFTKNHENKH